MTDHPFVRPSLVIAGSVALLFTAACLQWQGPPLTAAAAPYRPLRFSGDVPSRPGAIAWSPDGRQLAFIRSGVAVAGLEGESPAVRRLDVPSPRFLAWAGDNTLYVLTRDSAQDALFAVNLERSDMVRLPLDRRADAVYPAGPGDAFLLSIETSRRRIGTDVRVTLSLLALDSGATATLYNYSRIVPATERDQDFLAAWSHAGPNPLDGSFLIMEHVKPPVFPPYTLVRAFDPATGDLADIAGQEPRTLFASAGWSADGRWIALTGSDGRLFVKGAGDAVSFDIGAPVMYPSWHPGGGMLVAGGALIDASTGRTTPLVEEGGDGYARWSPDGTRLALAAKGALYVFSGFPAPSHPPLDLALKRKLILLRELLGGELITAEDYRARRTRLLQDTKGGP